MTSIFVWGPNADSEKARLTKQFRMRFERKKKRFVRSKADKRVLKKIMDYCLENKINYKTDDGRSYEVVESELVESSNRELRDWGPDISKESPDFEETDYEQMWEEHKEEE